MRLRTIGFAAAALSAALVQTSSAVVTPKGSETGSVAAGRAPRAHRTTSWARASQMSAVGLTGWTAMVDSDTQVPVRMWGPSPFFAGSVAKPEVAEAAARAFLAQHVGLLAPGSSAADFAVIANQTDPDGEIRSVGFQQLSGGVKVLGGAVSFTFKRDRLIMVGSTALPNVHIAATAPTRETAARLQAQAVNWLADDGFAVSASKPSDERVIVALVHPRTGAAPDVEFHLAEQVTVSSTTADPGQWNVWLDAATGAPLLRKSTLMFASGKVLFDVPDRYPTSTRSAKPAPQDSHMVNGVAQMSAADGTITWSDAGDATITPGLSGPLVQITNKAGSLTTDQLTVADGGTVTWSKADDEAGDAQLDAYVFAMQAKAYTKASINPQLSWLDEQLSVNVNENQTCNAYSTGDDIHFYKAKPPSNTGSTTATACQNTGRIADVVYHEFGHSVHANSFIPGVGAFDDSLSEGLADSLAALITNDHGMGRGFFYTDEPLRELAPATPKHWPEDADGEPHDEGEIIGETLWMAKTAMETQYGADAGNAKYRKLYYGVVQRSSDIPTSYAEALVTDDDDGDLTNGTPNMCLINNAWGLHGLTNPEVALGITPPTRDSFTIHMSAHPPSNATQCPNGATLQSAKLSWRKHGGDAQDMDLAVAGNDYTATIPTQPDGTTVEYKVTVTLTDGSKISYPDNPADPYYQFYVGNVQTLWCADFESGAGDWTHGATPANRDEWEAGMPMGLGGDPKTAHGGNNVFGIDLSQDGMYRRSVMTWAESPSIDLQGMTNVRLQYWRWLGVEDGFYDNANVLVNGTKIWNNFASAMDTMNGVNHIDKEWRFQDFDLTDAATAAVAADGKLKLRFELNSDPGFNLGGWTLDDVCVVAAAPAPTCGNGVVDDGEQCDDGNIDDGDGCSPTCTLPGDGGKDDTGCCSVGATPGGAALLSMLTLGMLIRRRRRT